LHVVLSSVHVCDRMSRCHLYFFHAPSTRTANYYNTCRMMTSAAASGPHFTKTDHQQ
jgi:hypothetical protein